MIQHLALVMDGNRRWARARQLEVLCGHRQGVQAIHCVIDFCLHKKIPYLSLYTFSIENLHKRSQEEQNYLFELAASQAEILLPSLLEKKVKVRVIGEKALFPQKVRAAIDRIENNTLSCTSLQLNMLFCYGARQEILSGVKCMINSVLNGEIDQENIDEQLFASSLWTSGIPDPELIIRTGGTQRLSNFLLYQAAYAELRFLDCLWPELTYEHLEREIKTFNAVQRNFGA